MSGRDPMRSERSPAIGATGIGMPVHGPELTVHSSDSSEPPKSSRIDGSATPTTRLSSAVMNSATETIASVQPERVRVGGEDTMRALLVVCE